MYNIKHYIRENEVFVSYTPHPLLVDTIILKEGEDEVYISLALIFNDSTLSKVEEIFKSLGFDEVLRNKGFIRITDKEIKNVEDKIDSLIELHKIMEFELKNNKDG